MRLKLLRDEAHRSVVKATHVQSELMVAELLTKDLKEPRLRELRALVKLMKLDLANEKEC